MLVYEAAYGHADLERCVAEHSCKELTAWKRTDTCAPSASSGVWTKWTESGEIRTWHVLPNFSKVGRNAEGHSHETAVAQQHGLRSPVAVAGTAASQPVRQFSLPLPSACMPRSVRVALNFIHQAASLQLSLLTRPCICCGVLLQSNDSPTSGTRAAVGLCCPVTRYFDQSNDVR